MDDDRLTLREYEALDNLYGFWNIYKQDDPKSGRMWLMIREKYRIYEILVAKGYALSGHYAIDDMLEKAAQKGRLHFWITSIVMLFTKIYEKDGFIHRYAITEKGRQRHIAHTLTKVFFL